MLSFCITLHPHTHMRRLHRLALRGVLQARSLSAALRAGTGAEKRVATGLFAAGRVGWCGGGPGGMMGWRAGWGRVAGRVRERGGGPDGVAGREGWRAGWGGWGGGPGGGWVGPGGGGPGGVLAGRMGGVGAYVHIARKGVCMAE